MNDCSIAQKRRKVKPSAKQSVREDALAACSEIARCNEVTKSPLKIQFFYDLNYTCEASAAASKAVWKSRVSAILQRCLKKRVLLRSSYPGVILSQKLMRKLCK